MAAEESPTLHDIEDMVRKVVAENSAATASATSARTSTDTTMALFGQRIEILTKNYEEMRVDLRTVSTTLSVLSTKMEAKNNQGQDYRYVVTTVIALLAVLIAAYAVFKK